MYIGYVQYVVPEKNVGGSDLHVIQSHLLSSRQQAVLTLNNFCYVHMFARRGKIVFVKVFIYFPQKVETDSHPISFGNDGCMYVEHIAVLLGQQNTHLSDRLQGSGNLVPFLKDFTSASDMFDDSKKSHIYNE